MAARVAAFDWSDTPLGPQESWPASLRTAVGICLNNRFAMMIWWGPERINIYNDGYARVLGKRHPDALGKSGPAIWQDVWAEIEAQVDAVFLRGESTWNDRVYLRMERNGVPEDTWHTWSYSPIYDEDGRVAGMLNVVVDNTAEVLAEQVRARETEQKRRLDQARAELAALRDVERQKLSEMFEAAPAFMAMLRGPMHVFDMANERYLALVRRQDIIGKPVAEALPEVIDQGFVQLLDEVYQTGRTHVGNEVPVMIGPAGETGLRYVNFVYQAVRGAGGSISGIFVHGFDVTDFVQAREAVRANENRFRNLANALPQIVWTARPDGRVDYYNRRWYEYIGCDESHEAAADWCRHIHPEDLPRLLEVWERCVATGEPYAYEPRLRNGQGEYRHFLVRGLPLRDTDGSIRQWLGTCTDIEERRRYEAEREHLLASERAARSESDRAGRMKDEFLATLSHEIRTPLNAILGWSRIMRGATEPSDIQQGAEIIERNARAQSQIIDDLLDMSRIISGKVRLTVARVDLGSVVQTAVDAARPTADAKGLHLHSRIEPLDDVTVNGDVSRLHQVLWNLVSNAIKFTPRGGQVLVQVRVDRSGGHVHISVIDTGEGIPADFLPYVFDRFRQADASTTRRHGGLGLGLSIVKQLVELHGGTVRVFSSGAGHGTTFTVSLPMTATAPQPEEGLDRPRDLTLSHLDGLAAKAGSIAGVRVLVIDDEPDARALVKRLLEDRDAVATTAGSALEAMNLIQSHPFDVIVSDIGMPGEDGFSLIRRIRALGSDRGGNTPAIALTAYARTEDRIRAISAGFMAHLAKPVEPVELITMVAGAAGRVGR